MEWSVNHQPHLNQPFINHGPTIVLGPPRHCQAAGGRAQSHHSWSGADAEPALTALPQGLMLGGPMVNSPGDLTQHDTAIYLISI